MQERIQVEKKGYNFLFTEGKYNGYPKMEVIYNGETREVRLITEEKIIFDSPIQGIAGIEGKGVDNFEKVKEMYQEIYNKKEKMEQKEKEEKYAPLYAELEKIPVHIVVKNTKIEVGSTVTEYQRFILWFIKNNEISQVKKTEILGGLNAFLSGAWSKYEKIRSEAKSQFDKICSEAESQYEKIRSEAESQYDKILSEAKSQYIYLFKKIRIEAKLQYDKILSEAESQYEEICLEVWSQYDKIRSEAKSQYEKIRSEAWSQYDKIRSEAKSQYDKEIEEEIKTIIQKYNLDFKFNGTGR